MVNPINLSGQLGHDDIWPSVVVIVLENHAHPGESTAVFRQGSPGFEAALGECTIPIVVEQVLLHAVIRHEHVSKAILVIIGERYAQGATFLCRDA